MDPNLITDYHATIDLPDEGEHGVFVRLNLPTGETVVLMYKAHYGTLDVLLPEECEALCLGEGLRPALPARQLLPRGAETPSFQPHCRSASQIILAVGPTREG